MNRTEQKQRTHEQILDAAARLFAERGYDAASVDAVMREAGLTHGGFYAHFDSKADLFAELIGHAIESRRATRERGLGSSEGSDWLGGTVDRYLSQSHRRSLAGGCPVAALASELARAPEPIRRSTEPALRRMHAELAKRFPTTVNGESERRAWALFALCVGGLTLSRAMASERVADEVLAACRAAAGRLIDEAENHDER